MKLSLTLKSLYTLTTVKATADCFTIFQFLSFSSVNSNCEICAAFVRLSRYSTSFTPAALSTRPTAMKAITKNPISFENSLLNPRYTPITTIAISTSDCALLKNQLYKFYPKFILHFSFQISPSVFESLPLGKSSVVLSVFYDAR